MFSNKIVGSSKFLKMPATARLLYYDLGMRADKNGYIDSFCVLKVTDASKEDLDCLVKNNFVKRVDDFYGIKIVNWRENNGTLNKERGWERFSGNRIIVLERDNNMCGMCGSKDHIVVHHIDGYKKGHPENNEVNKLITLCGKCHYAVHHGLEIPKQILCKIGYYENF